MQRIRPLSAALAALALTVLVMACDSGSSTNTQPDTFTLTVTLQGLGVGTVSNDATGIACDTTGATCSADIPEGTEVTLTATADAGSEFVGWGSDGSANPLTFTMNADKAVTAEFDNPQLAMETVGSGGGTVMSRDSAITLVIPAGALSGNEDITIEIVDPADLGAEWSELRDSSAIAAGYQMGPDGLQFAVPATVRLSPDSVSLTGDSSTVVTTPGFMTTEGDTAAALDSVVVDADLVAGSLETWTTLDHFSPLVQTVGGVDFSLTVNGTTTANVSDIKSVTINVEDPYELANPNGPEPTVEAENNALENFGSDRDAKPWKYLFECKADGTARVIVRAEAVGPDGDRRIAFFVFQITCIGRTLDVTTSGQGTGNVTAPNYDGNPLNPGIDCGSQGADCTEDYADGTDVTLTATPDAGSALAGWTVNGADVPDDGTGKVTVTMDENTTVDARFEPVVSEELSVSLDGSGDGTVTSDPAGIDCTKTGTTVTGDCTGTFDHGSTVALTATDGDGSTITDWSGDGTTDADGRRSVEMSGTRSVGMTFPNVPAAVTVLQLAALQVYYFEALSLVNAAFPFVQPSSDIAKMTAGQACPTVLAAGDGAVLALNSCTGEMVQQYDFSAFSFYDAWAIPGPDGVADANAIFASGQNYAIFWIDDTGAVTDQIGQVNWGTALDATPINGDPKNGLAVSVDDGFGQVLYFVRYDPSVGYTRVLDNYFGVTTTPPAMQSAYTAGLPDDPAGQPEEAIAVGHTYSTGQIWYMESISDQYPVGSYVADLPGDDPRRIRCDLDSGTCAVTDFSNSLVTVVLWSGTGNPTVAENTTAGQIASGPVGLDVYGHFIVTAGYNDDQYSIIEVDDTGAILNVTTQALPAECSAPGHAKFLRDGANTILVSCNASQAIVRIPNAF